jgi:hypothetical protein
MRTLLLGTVVYLLGIAITLFLRPGLMFLPNGQWKEFGFTDESKTIFPFWMFCLIWAVVSYLISNAFFSDGPVHLVRNTAAATLLSAAPHSITARAAVPDDEELEDLVETLPVKPSKKSKRRAPQAETPAPAPAPAPAPEASAPMKPGYYRLNKNATERNGVPRYIYVGPEAPAATSDEED